MTDDQPSGPWRPSTESIPEAEVVEDRPTPAPRPDSAPVPPPAPRRSGAFLGFVLGGVIATAAGVALARFVPGILPAVDTTDLTVQLEQQNATMADLRQQVEALGARQTPDISAELAKVRSEFEARLAAIPQAPDASALLAEARSASETALAGLDARLTDLEKRPAGVAGSVSDSALAAYDRELQAMRDDLAAQRGAASGASDELKTLVAQTQEALAAAAAEAARLKSEAEAVGTAAMARAAANRISAALESGGPFASAVATLSETGHEVPAVLADAAAVGIPTLPDLQRSYPAAARDALDAALRADMGETWTERAATFLRTQTGARAISPIEGTDPDAILSRAEAALEAGDLPATLTELAALPDAAKAPLAGWIAEAEQREAAIAATSTLVTALDVK